MNDKFKKVSELPVVDKLEDGNYVASIVNGKVAKVKAKTLIDSNYFVGFIKEVIPVNIPEGIPFKKILTA